MKRLRFTEEQIIGLKEAEAMLDSDQITK